MRGPTHAGLGRRVAVVLVRNAVDHDSRVLREARTLKALGLDTTVLGVVSFTQTREVTEQDGIVVRRLGPGSRLGWRVLREISSLRPEGPSAEQSGRRASPRLVPPGGASPGQAPSHVASARPASPRGAARRFLRWLSTLGYYARAVPVVRALRPDIVHCNDYNTMWIGVAARILCGSAVVYDSHELWADRNLRSEPRPWLVACEALFTRVADSVVTTSPAYAEELARRYRIPAPVVVRNIPERPPDRPASGDQPGPSGDGDGGATADPRLVVYVGGLQPGRGLEPAVRALPLVPGARLKLLGPGAPEYRAGLLELIRSLRLDDRVELADPVPPEELLDAVRGAGVGLALIQPTSLSYRLTLPNKLFEYALAGLPILGSDLPMIERFISEHRLGVTVDPDDVDAVARALREMLEPERNEAYRGQAARAASVLDAGAELEVLAAVYRDALSTRGRAPAGGTAARSGAAGEN